MKKQILFTISLAALLASATQASQEQLAKSIRDAHQETTRTSEQLKATLSALNDLTQQKQGDLRPAYKTYCSEVAKTGSAAESTRKRVQWMGDDGRKAFPGLANDGQWHRQRILAEKGNATMNNEQEPLPQEATELLRRVLAAVEPAKPRHGFEIACAIVLALATTASAWCAYQSKLWGGAQMARGNAAFRASREGAVNSLAALQGRAFDASMFINYMQARLERNDAMEAFLFQRFRPEMKPAVEAWLKLDPLNNTNAPPSPFRLAEYTQEETAEVARQAELAAKAMTAAGEARRLSDNYVLLTVVFASVLFFGGIARAFDSRPLRITLAALAVLLFLGTLVALSTMPICHE